MARSTIAKSLRKQMTDAERLLWERLRCKQMEGYKFRRQCPIGRYIVDFVCLEKRLVMEVDGGQHAVRREADAARSAWLATRGYKVLRSWNHEVLHETGPVSEPYGVTLL
jgi:very-short-patch-repair endonuclease